MGWSSFHRRGEVLRDVLRAADERRDGVLPMDVTGVAETFAGPTDLLGALHLRWHTRLSGRIERELSAQPLDLPGAVVAAWHATADELPGVRAILDRHRADPVDEAMAAMLAKAVGKEHRMLAILSGQAGTDSDEERARAAGERLELAARATYAPTRTAAASRTTLLDRLRAALAA